MFKRSLPPLMKSCRFLLPSLLVLSGCGEGLSETEPGSEAGLETTQQSLFEDTSCSGITVGGWTRDTNGWTVFPDASTLGGRKIYVSNPVTGTDDPVNGIYYVDTLTEGLNLLRKGNPDSLFLARGQTFTGSIPTHLLGGASITRPMVIRSYGTGVRPVLRSRFEFAGNSVSHLAIADLDIQGDGTGYGIRWAKLYTAGQPPGVRNILFENIRVQRFQVGMSIESFQDAATPAAYYENITLRRSQVLDNWGDDHSQGLYATGIRGLTIEESVFDHNGFRTRDDATYEMSATIFAHNMYLQTGNKCVRVVGNVSADAASHGLQARSGGVVHDNFLVRNPLAMSWGLVNGGSVENKTIEPGLSGSIVGNVVWESTDISSDTPRNGGIELGNARTLLVQNNVMAHHLRGNVAGTGLIFSARMGIGLHNLQVEGNTVHNLNYGIEFNGNGWGPVTVRTDGSVADPAGTTLITALNSGLPARSTPLSISDTGSIFRDNRLSRIARYTVYAANSGGHITHMDYASNFYDCVNGTAACTSYGSLSSWLTRTGETGYRTGLVPFVQSSRSIGTYLQQIYPGTPLLDSNAAYAQYMDRVRNMEKRTWDARFLGSSISRYLRDGFAVVP